MEAAIIHHPTSLFVTGTDTGIGKTLASAVLCRVLGAAYWKPLQTGTQDGDNDTQEVARLAQLGPYQLFPPARTYADPSSPEQAARLEGQRVSVAEVLPLLPPVPLVIEGAGGVLVPINEQETMLDLMAALGFPVVVVARSTLGTINHTLLTLGAIRARGLKVQGVILSGPPAPHNAEAIARHGQVKVLAQFPVLDDVSPQVVAQLARTISLS